MDVLSTLEIDRWEGPFSEDNQARAVEALEAGRLLYLPRLSFAIGDAERRFLSPDWSNGKAKNISYDPSQGRLRGTTSHGPDREALQVLVGRYATMTRQLLEALLPKYRSHLIQARTSFRPVDAAGRPSSINQDDSRLHPDAFNSRPTRGLRILRVFSNVNPEGQPRVWRVGEPFEAMARQILPTVRPPLPGVNVLLAMLRITKGRRTLYDSVMLQLHNRVKANQTYQDHAPQATLSLAAGSTWIVFTDQVLHAVLSGQYLLEQTFHLPVEALCRPELSPLRVLEQLSGRVLVE